MPNYVAQYKSKNLLLLGQATVYASHYYRKAIVEYCSIEKKTTKTNVLMELIRRIECNSSAIRSLVENSIKNESKPFLKLPIGLLIRSCLIDSILGLYLSALDESTANEIINDFNQDYVKAMPDRYEVYLDRCATKKYDDEFLKHMYGLQIEDTYPNHIDWSAYHKEDTSKYGFFKIKSHSRFTISNAYKYLKNDDRFSLLFKKLYAYYREYSQYEHFSVFSHASYTAAYDDDKPLMAKPFEYISHAVEYIGVNMALSEKMEESFNKAYEGIEKILHEEI